MNILNGSKSRNQIFKNPNTKERSRFRYKASQPAAIILDCCCLIKHYSVSIKGMMQKEHGTKYCAIKICLNCSSWKILQNFFSQSAVLLYRHPLAIFKKHEVIHISSTSETRGVNL